MTEDQDPFILLGEFTYKPLNREYRVFVERYERCILFWPPNPKDEDFEVRLTHQDDDPKCPRAVSSGLYDAILNKQKFTKQQELELLLVDRFAHDLIMAYVTTT